MAKNPFTFPNVAEARSDNVCINNYNNEAYCEICRTCSSIVKKLNTICIDSIQMIGEDTLLRNKLYFYCPELDLRIISKVVICVNCIEIIDILNELILKYNQNNRQFNKHPIVTLPLTQHLKLVNCSNFTGLHDIKTEEVDVSDVEDCLATKKFHLHTLKYNNTGYKQTRRNNLKLPMHNLKQYKCSQCSYCTTIKDHFKIHMHIHTCKKAFNCFQCDYGTNRKSDLSIHFRKHASERPFKCSECDYSSNRKGDLKIHMHVHTTEKPFKCYKCNYKCKRQNDLKVHMRVHTSEKPFKCFQCNYKCNQSNHLKMHLRFHTGENPFKCLHCHYKSNQKSHLKIHMRIHTDEEPFKCSKCDYRSYRVDHLAIHMRIHIGEKPFKCLQCNYKCTQRSHLRFHMRNHNGEKPFKCD